MRIHLHVLVFITWTTNMVKSQGYMDPEKDSCKSCEHKYTYRGSRNGIFTSPMFPDNYPERTKCCYFFQAKDAGRVRIEFDYFDLEPSDNDCRYDFIEISSINARGFKEQPKALYCGTATPPVYISTHSKLEIIFESDVTTNARGFIGHYEFLDKNWHPFPPSTIGCGPGYLTGPGGTINSPNYPRAFPAESGCAWVIQGLPGQQILLTFIALDITGSDKCQSTNLLMVFDGFTMPNQDPVRYCGQLEQESKQRRQYVSSTNRLVIRFQSGSNYGNKKGFYLSWTAVTLQEQGICSGFQCTGAGAEVCEGALGKDICNYHYYCIDETLRCNELPNCGSSDNSDENKCLDFIMRYVGIVCGSVLVAVLVIVVIVTCCYKRRQRDRVKYSMPKDQSLTHSMNTFMSTQSSNVPVRSLDHSPRSSCVMYTTSFTDCALNEQSTPNHLPKPTLTSFANNSNSLHPTNCNNSDTATATNNGIKEDAKDDIIDSPISYKGHQKRPSYHMMRELCYEDGNIVLADI